MTAERNVDVMNTKINTSNPESFSEVTMTAGKDLSATDTTVNGSNSDADSLRDDDPDTNLDGNRDGGGDGDDGHPDPNPNGVARNDTDVRGADGHQDSIAGRDDADAGNGD